MKKILLLLLIATSSHCQVYAQELSNKNATKATKALYQNLHKLSKKQVLFGHQDDLAYGVGWKYEPGKSDIKETVNDYPAVYGWDLGKIEHQREKNLDGVPFDKMREYIKTAHQKGAVITISWHADNPLTNGSSWDTAHHTVKSILPNGEKHEIFKTWLDRVSVFLQSLKNAKGEEIPVLFRPFHELKGKWFWWGRNTTSPEEYKAIWRFTVNYLQNQKKLNNLIWVYNTNEFDNENEFLESYPGDDVVDVLSFDQYQYGIEGKKKFINTVKKQLDITTKLATEKNKLSAFAETGFENIPDPSWWTGTLWPAIKDYPISYVLVWRNAGYMPSTKKMHYYAPYKGQASAKDFKKFYQNKKVWFEKMLSTKNLYQTK
ncbi:glycoside hydrolase family 26 protein [Pedobacter sp. SL55]|uniref:glycoside hydrolase family 26 protein n=1 Tax=Pedobacter sp. SL55 TaxID=2995161 RepID=UPI00226D8F15|nr:glycosyl hydrolase [Pedobacter sp. SL55]WAC42456.1 glycosyl hydrolase [Pedobacter sp. SL55]